MICQINYNENEPEKIDEIINCEMINMSKERFNQNGNYYPPDWIKKRLSNYSARMSRYKLWRIVKNDEYYCMLKNRIEETEYKLGIHNPKAAIERDIKQLLKLYI